MRKPVAAPPPAANPAAAAGPRDLVPGAGAAVNDLMQFRRGFMQTSPDFFSNPASGGQKRQLLGGQM